ncbi:mitochondrial large subunit ribosomal protein-domain-containing protein [Xylariaceae sp. AK1471]|nr:mitochondrial large subunit ribosomal protein-domain-containing protein [Xylariaceae sp. AK1471]
MLSRSLRPLTARATSLATTPIRSNTFLGPFCIRALATLTDAAALEPITITPTLSTINAPPQLPYFVSRNNLNNLSVYQKKKRGGNYHVTLIKRGEGDLIALKQDIRDALQLSDSDVFVNSVTRHVTIKGHKRDEVVNFLHTLGF